MLQITVCLREISPVVKTGDRVTETWVIMRSYAMTAYFMTARYELFNCSTFDQTPPLPAVQFFI